ncbi:unnamed protein product [Prorocentrum cordatum]|uniref:Uncharacterized protein n=1 Tax=Prorocentrum cordatum TaxID=2364126 RepID=A0ABN9WQQ4_9DINO|nr:unnamed protein product [Polarella glacialis]
MSAPPARSGAPGCEARPPWPRWPPAGGTACCSPSAASCSPSATTTTGSAPGPAAARPRLRWRAARGRARAGWPRGRAIRWRGACVGPPSPGGMAAAGASGSGTRAAAASRRWSISRRPCARRRAGPTSHSS